MHGRLCHAHITLSGSGADRGYVSGVHLLGHSWAAGSFTRGVFTVYMLCYCYHLQVNRWYDPSVVSPQTNFRLTCRANDASAFIPSRTPISLLTFLAASKQYVSSAVIAPAEDCNSKKSAHRSSIAKISSIYMIHRAIAPCGGQH